MTLYIGVDFHPHQQTISYCNTDWGEVEQTFIVPQSETGSQILRTITESGGWD
jgi:hypothetical protein